MFMQSEKSPSNESVRDRLGKRAVRNRTGLFSRSTHYSFVQLVVVCCISLNLFAFTECQFLNKSKHSQKYLHVQSLDKIVFFFFNMMVLKKAYVPMITNSTHICSSAPLTWE